MFDKEKRKGTPERDRRYLIAAIVIGLVGLLAALGLFLDRNCWFRVGCNSLPPVTATPLPPFPTFTPLPPAMPTSAPGSIQTSTPLPATPLTQESSRLPSSETAEMAERSGDSSRFSPLRTTV